jgi:hypothetical protein
MADVLDLACRKRKTSKTTRFALDDFSCTIPLDRTVASLQGRSSLIILKRALLDSFKPGAVKKPGGALIQMASTIMLMSWAVSFASFFANSVSLIHCPCIVLQCVVGGEFLGVYFPSPSRTDLVQCGRRPLVSRLHDRPVGLQVVDRHRAKLSEGQLADAPNCELREDPLRERIRGAGEHQSYIRQHEQLCHCVKRSQ